MTGSDISEKTVSGHVKWFDPARGFGFIVSEEHEGDILLRAEVLVNFGQSSIADSCEIVARIQKTARGAQVIGILEIRPPEADNLAPRELAGMPEPEQIRALPLEPARVKWFDKAKGFGFANIFGEKPDVFIHIEVLRASGMSDLATGEAVALRVVDGDRGRMAVQVLAWESSMKERA